MESQSQSRAKYDRSRIESYIQTREAMITTTTNIQKSSKTKAPAVSSQRRLEPTKTEPPLKFVKLPPSKEKLFCIYLDKFQTVVHSFITEFLESQVFQLPRQAVPNNYNIKTKIKLMNYILLKFDPRSRKLLQEEVLSTMCHLICHHRKLLRSDSYRNCDLSKCNAPDLIWALKEDHTRHLDQLLRRLQSEYKAQAEAYDPESVRAQQAYMEATLIPIYTGTSRPASPRVIPAMHYKNVIQQIFHKRGCGSGQDHSSSSTVYTVRKDTQFPPPPFDTASLHFGQTDKGKSAQILTSISRDQLQPGVSKSRTFFKSPSGPSGDNQDSYAYTGLFGIRSPEERKILECRVAAHLKSLGGKCGFQVRPCSAAASTYGRMIVNEITTLQNFEDSLLNYSLVSKCIPLLWCGTGPDGKPLLYPTDYKMGDCGTRIGQTVHNLALQHHLFGGPDCRRSRPRKKRKGRSVHSDSSASGSSRRDGGGGAGSSVRSPNRTRKKGKMDKFTGKSHSTTSLSTVASAANRYTLKRANRFAKPHHKSVSARRPSGRLRGRPRAKELANKTTSVLQGMLALEFERSNGNMSSEAHVIQTELEYRKMMAEKGEGPMESDQESRSSAGRGGKGKQKSSVNSGQRKISGRRSHLSIRESGISFVSTKSCGTLCDQAAQTQDPASSTRRSRINVHDKGTMGKRPSQSHQYGIKEQQFRTHGGMRSSRGEMTEETMTAGHRKSGGFVPGGKIKDMARQSRINDRIPRNSHRPSMYGMKPPISKQSVSVQYKQQNHVRKSMPSHPLHKGPRNSRDAQNQSPHTRERSKSTQVSPPRSPQRSPHVNEGMLELSQVRRSRQGFSSHGIQTDDRYNRGSIGIQVRAAGDNRRSRDESHIHGRSSVTSTRQTRASLEKGRGSWDQHGGKGVPHGTRDSYKKEGRLSTFGVQTTRGGSQSQGVQTRPEWRYGGEELEMEDEGVGDRWEMVHRFKLSHNRGTGEMFRMEMAAEDMDVEDESTGYTRRGSNIGTDPMSHHLKDAHVGSPPKHGRGGVKVTTGVGRERAFSGTKATRDKDVEVQVSDEDDRRSNSSERRWKHATFSRTLVKGPVHIGPNGPPHGHGRGGKRMTGLPHVAAVVSIGRNGSRLKFSQRNSQTVENHTPESTLRIQMRKKTGFVKNEPNMQHSLSTIYEATAKKKGGKGSTEAQTHGHSYAARKAGLHDTEVGTGKKRPGSHTHAAPGQHNISSLSRFPKLDKGLNTDQVRRDKFFESLKAPRQGKGKAHEEKVSSSVGPMTGSYADVSHWRNVERVAEYSKSMRAISKGKPLPWNVRPDGWDEFGKANTGRPIGFGDDDLTGLGLGMIDSNLGFPAIMRQRVERRGDGSTCPEVELAERKSSKLLPTQDKDEIIDLTIPQENFFWVPLGRYSWEVRNIKVWKSQFVPTKEKLGSSSRDIMGIFPQLKIPNVKESNSACFDSDTQVNRPKRFVSCSDICSVCMLDSGFCQCD